MNQSEPVSGSAQTVANPIPTSRSPYARCVKRRAQVAGRVEQRGIGAGQLSSSLEAEPHDVQEEVQKFAGVSLVVRPDRH